MHDTAVGLVVVKTVAPLRSLPDAILVYKAYKGILASTVFS